MRRPWIAAAAFALAVSVVAIGTGGESFGMTDHDNGGHSTDMDDGHGMGGHGKNARVVEGAREIAVKAKSFDFVPNEISITAGESVTIVMRSNDVFHDFVVQGEGHIVGAKRKKTARGGLEIEGPAPKILVQCLRAPRRGNAGDDRRDLTCHRSALCSARRPPFAIGRELPVTDPVGANAGGARR